MQDPNPSNPNPGNDGFLEKLVVGGAKKKNSKSKKSSKKAKKKLPLKK